MSYTFRVVFSGVCAYVPNSPFFLNVNAETDPVTKQSVSTNPEQWKRSTTVTSLAVLLPDLRRPATPSFPDNSKLNFPTFREPHFPLLKFRLGDLREGTTRRVDLVCRDISQQDEEGLLFLRREQIRFYVDAENTSPFSFSGWVPPDPRQPLPKFNQREQLESLWWLPDLARIVEDPPEAMKARADVLPSYRGPFPEGLIARVECKGGRLRTFDFNRGVDGFPIPWRFAPPRDGDTPGTWNRALSNSVALEFFDVRNEVRIQLKRLANEVITEEIVLAPAPGASRPVLEISITNREPDLLFQEEGFGRTTLPDMDFQPFYEQLSVFGQNENKAKELPIPHPARSSFFGIRENPCAGTVMVGQGGATSG